MDTGFRRQWKVNSFSYIQIPLKSIDLKFWWCFGTADGSQIWFLCRQHLNLENASLQSELKTFSICGIVSLID